MADAVLLNTRELSTGVSRGQQPQAMLTTLQIRDVERTWKLVEGSGLLEAGITLFKKIFTICPAAQNMFKTFKDVAFTDLPENEDFRAHGLRVTEAISLAVATLDDMETLLMMLKDLGAAHHTVGLDQSYFDVVGQGLIETLEEGLGSEFTPEVKEAYLAFYGIVTNNMKEGLSEALEAAEEL